MSQTYSTIPQRIRSVSRRLHLLPHEVAIPKARLTKAFQEISTENYPTDSSRATILVGGFNQSIAISGTDAGLDGCNLRNVQVSLPLPSRHTFVESSDNATCLDQADPDD